MTEAYSTSLVWLNYHPKIGQFNCPLYLLSSTEKPIIRAIYISITLANTLKWIRDDDKETLRIKSQTVPPSASFFYEGHCVLIYQIRCAQLNSMRHLPELPYRWLSGTWSSHAVCLAKRFTTETIFSFCWWKIRRIVSEKIFTTLPPDKKSNLRTRLN